MARQGDVIANPRRRESVRLLETAAETGGARLVMAAIAEPCEVSPPKHMHPHQTETFSVTRGELWYVLGDSNPRVARAGEVVTVQPGVAHTWWNAGSETLEVVGRLEPAGRFQVFLETVYGLIRDGKVTSNGIPHPLQMAVIAHEFRDDIVFTAVPAPIRAVAIPIAAFVGRRLGYRAWYPAYSEPESAMRRQPATVSPV